LAKYMVFYTGGGGMGASPEEPEHIMGEWGMRYGNLGAAIVDGGSPFGQTKHLAGDEVGDGPLGDMPAAACADHPHLGHGGQVQVFTCIDKAPPE